MDFFVAPPSSLCVFAAIEGDIVAATMTTVGGLAAILVSYIYSLHLENVGYDPKLSESSFFGTIVVLLLLISVRMTIVFLGAP